MSHTPVRAGNLPAPVGPYSPGMGFEKLIFVSGQGGTDPATGKIADNVEQQTEQCLKNVQTIREAAGSGLPHVLRCGVFLMDVGEFTTKNVGYPLLFGRHPHAPPHRQRPGPPGDPPLPATARAPARIMAPPEPLRPSGQRLAACACITIPTPTAI